MKLITLIDQLYSQPTLITPEAHQSIRQLLETRLDDAVNFNPEAVQRTGTYCGNKVNLPSMEVLDGIAYIPVAGAIGYKLSGFAKYAGAVDSGDVARDIAEAEADDKVQAVMFEVDSPGGMVTGTAELADAIDGMDKPTMVFSDGMIASAAYWVASAADEIFTTRGAQVGSIGVYLPVYDYTEALKMEGVTVELIKAGKLKGIGYPGTQLSKEGRDHLQARVNQIYGEFKKQVRGRRGQIADETMQGQTFYAPESLSKGLIDGMVRTRADAVSLLRARAGI